SHWTKGVLNILVTNNGTPKHLFLYLSADKRINIVTNHKLRRTSRANVWTLAKALAWAVLVTSLTMSCTLDKQAKALRALEKCQYEFVSADSVFLAGADVNKLVANGRVDVSQL